MRRCFYKCQSIRNLVAMKICAICRGSDILCSGCGRKLEKGEISSTEVEVSRSLHMLVKDRVNFVKAVADRNKIVVVCEKKDCMPIIGRGGKNVKALSKTLGKEVRIVKKAPEKEMIESILGVPLIGINIVYGNGEIKRLRIDRRFKRLRSDTVMLGKVLGNRYEIVFE